MSDLYKTEKCLVRIYWSSNTENYDKKAKEQAAKKHEEVKEKFKDLFASRSGINYDYEVYFNLTKAQLNYNLRLLAINGELMNYDGLVLIIISNGYDKKIQCFDGKEVEFDQVIDKFNEDDCKYLKGKPKMIILNLNQKIHYEIDEQMDNVPIEAMRDSPANYISDEEKSHKQNKLTNFITVRCIIEGEVTDDNPTSIDNYSKIQDKFVDALIKIIREKGDEELQYMLIELHCELNNNLKNDKFSFNLLKYGFSKRFYFNHKKNETTRLCEKSKKLIENSTTLKGIRIESYSGSKTLIIEGEHDIDLKIVTNKLIQKKESNFFALIISSSKTELIEALTFNGFIFNNIIFTKDASNLKHVDLHAFGNGSTSIQGLTIGNELCNNVSITDFSNRFINLEEIEITSPNQIKGQFKLPNLKMIQIIGSNSTKLKSIGNNPFYYCDKLKDLSLSDNQIEDVTENSFCFENKSKKNLALTLERNKLNSSSFKKASLINFNRPVTLNLKENQITYLYEEVFKPFFDANGQNQIFVDKSCFRENHEKNRWNQSADYKNRIII